MRISFWGLLIGVCSSTTLLGDEPPPPPVAESLNATIPFEARWLNDLSSDEFGIREQATRRLYAAGETAVGPICDAVAGLDREAATRAIDILDKLSQSSDATVRSAATAGLKTLETSDNFDVASLAQAARLKWDPLPKAEDNPRQVRLMARARLQFQVGGNGRMLNGRVVNGERSLTLREPGKRTEIQDVNGKKIRITVTETVNGQPKVQQYLADDEADLARKHPEAAAIYKGLQQNFEVLGKMPANEGAAEPLKQERERLESRMAAQKDLLEKSKRLAMLKSKREATEAAQKEVDEARAALRSNLRSRLIQPR